MECQPFNKGKPTDLCRFPFSLLWMMFVLLPYVQLAQAPSPASPQNPSPMVDFTRPHRRIPKQEVPGKHFPLKTGTLYLSPTFHLQRRVPLLIHFHGAPWLLEHSVKEVWPQAALVTVQLGSGSGIYAKSFDDPSSLRVLEEEVREKFKETFQKDVQWGPVILTSFSAGYGAIRSILEQPENYSQIDAIFLADSLHTSYVPEGTPGKLEESLLRIFVRFAEDAARKQKVMWVTHSEVFPGTFASTTETSDYLLAQLNAKRTPVLHPGPIGMQQLSVVKRGGFQLMGYAGNSAPDHMDHLYGMEDWLKKFKRYVK
jgi:hypothetical protein